MWGWPVHFETVKALRRQEDSKGKLERHGSLTTGGWADDSDPPEGDGEARFSEGTHSSLPRPVTACCGLDANYLRWRVVLWFTRLGFLRPLEERTGGRDFPAVPGLLHVWDAVICKNHTLGVRGAEPFGVSQVPTAYSCYLRGLMGSP